MFRITIALLALALMTSACASLDAGVRGGAVSECRRVDAYGEDFMVVTFEAGELAQVFVDGDGDTDLDLHVFDENGNLIAADDDSLDVCYVSWRPRWTGKFLIAVENFGSVYNRYRIRTN